MIVPGVKYVPGRNDYSDRDGQKYGVAIHNTSNDAPASGEASYATRRTDGVSAHFYVDDREVIQSIDTKYRTGHAGSAAGNENAVSVEITGTNSKSRAWWIANVAWDDLGRVLAAVCRAYDIEPRRASVAEMRANPKVRAFYSHDDMRQAWGGTTHTDPGPNFPWDYLFASVEQAMQPATPPPAQEDDVTPEELRDRDIWPNPYGDKATNPTIALGTAVRNIGRDTDQALAEVRAMRAGLATVQAQMATLAGKDFTDEPAIVAGVLAGLSPEAIAAAIPAGIADQVADRLAARLAS